MLLQMSRAKVCATPRAARSMERARNSGFCGFSLDVAKRERLAHEMERLVCKGERNPVVLQRIAVSQFKYSESDVIAYRCVFAVAPGAIVVRPARSDPGGPLARLGADAMHSSSRQSQQPGMPRGVAGARLSGPLRGYAYAGPLGRGLHGSITYREPRKVLTGAAVKERLGR
jgi:hypothetical protein